MRKSEIAQKFQGLGEILLRKMIKIEKNFIKFSWKGGLNFQFFSGDPYQGRRQPLNTLQNTFAKNWIIFKKFLRKKPKSHISRGSYKKGKSHILKVDCGLVGTSFCGNGKDYHFSQEIIRFFKNSTGGLRGDGNGNSFSRGPRRDKKFFCLRMSENFWKHISPSIKK